MVHGALKSELSKRLVNGRLQGRSEFQCELSYCHYSCVKKYALSWFIFNFFTACQH